MKGHIGGSVTKGKTYSGRIGNLGLRGGKQNTISANAGFHASRNGLGLNGHFQKTNSYNGGLSNGKFNARGTIGKTQTGSLNANINRNGFSVNGNYGRGVFGRGIINVGNTRIGLSGRASQNTFGGAGLNFGRNSFSAHANIGRAYSAHAGLNVNGRNIGSVDASARASINANIGINKSGIHAQAGINGQAKADVKFGKTQIKAGISSDLKIKAGFDLKNGVHFGVTGGIHPNVSINRGGKTIKLLITPNEALEYIHNGKVFVTEYGIVRIRPGNKIIGQIFGNPIKRNH